MTDELEKLKQHLLEVGNIMQALMVRGVFTIFIEQDLEGTRKRIDEIMKEKAPEVEYAIIVPVRMYRTN